MPVFLTLFGLGIALFQTFILTGLYNFNLKPKWIVFLVTPLSIFISSCIDENAGLVALFVHFVSVFVLGIIGMIVQSFHGNEEVKTNETKTEIPFQANNSTHYNLFNPFFGIFYQIYVLVIIFLHIFIPKSSGINTEKIMEDFFNQFYFQIFSIVSLLIFSITYFLSLKTYHAQNEIIANKFQNKTAKFLFSNKAISFYIVVAGILTFNYFFDIRKNIPILIEQLSKPSLYNLYIGFFVFWLYQIALIIINPKQATLINIAKAKTFFKSGYLGIFMAAAFIPVFILLESQLVYFNMSSEIVLFLGFNIVLLVTEIMIFKRMKKGTFTTSKV